MSVKVMGLVWDYYPKGLGELLVALKVADHADHDGNRIWPSVSTLAAQTRQSERTVQRALGAMMKNGWLVLVKETSGRPGETRSYRIPVERIPEGVKVRVSNCHPSPCAQPVDKPNRTGDKSGIRRVTKTVQTGDTAVAPKPSLKAIVKKQPPVNANAAAACGQLLYPPNLSASQQHDMATYLKGLSPRAAQDILDEMTGLLERGINGTRVRDPMALFANLARQQDEGRLVLSHARRIQAEREGGQR